MGGIDAAVPHIGSRWSHDSWAIQSIGGNSFGYPTADGTWGGTILPIALFMVHGPIFRFGPMVVVDTDGGLEPRVQLHRRDRLSTWERGHWRRVSIADSQMDDVRVVLANLIDHWMVASPVTSARQRYARACIDDDIDDALLDLSIALETLYLNRRDVQKGRPGGRRGASFVAPSDPIKRRSDYELLRAFYEARNGLPMKDSRSRRSHSRMAGR